jgi:KaiC/GvpD/RAD55 family RecA-like ATPase
MGDVSADQAALEAALSAAARGWHVFPCGADKRPLTPHGFKDATANPLTVRMLFDLYPGPAVGIATGPSGLVVVDVDCKGDAPGYDEWHRLRQEIGPLAEDTVLVETPSGGLHVYYAANGKRIGSTAGRLAPGIDTRAEGGYVIGAGSPGYEYVDGHGPERLRKLPALLAEQLAFAPPATGDAPAELIPEGQRDATLASLAGTMRRRGMSPEEILAALQVANRTRCRPPLSEAQVEKIARSIGRYEPQAPAAAADAATSAPSGPPGAWLEYIDWPTFWATERSDEEWLFQDVLAASRAHSVYAKHGLGKSLFTTYMCAQIATEGRAAVCYLDYEMTEADLHERLDAMGYGPGTDLSRLKYALLPSLPPLDTPAGAEVLLGAIDALQAELPDLPMVCVIDTISRAVEGDENDADTVRAFYRCTGIGLKQRGVTWMRLDHAGKDKDRGQRGTSGKGDDVDVVWRLERTQSGIRLRREKARMGWVPETVQFGLFEGPLRFVPIAGDWPAGTGELANLLDRLEVPLDAPSRAVQKELVKVGESRRRELIVAALRWRRERLEEDARLAERGLGNHPRNHREPPFEHRQPQLPEPPGTTPDLASEPPPEPPGTSRARQVSVPGAPVRESPGTQPNYAERTTPREDG